MRNTLFSSPGRRAFWPLAISLFALLFLGLLPGISFGQLSFSPPGTPGQVVYKLTLDPLEGSRAYVSGPYYEILIEFGDGHFQRKTTAPGPVNPGNPVIVSFSHNYSSGPAPVARSIATPIYSKNDEPPAQYQITGPNPTGSVLNPLETYFAQASTEPVKIDLSWDILTDGDTFTVANIYRSDTATINNVVVSLFYDESFIEEVTSAANARTYRNETVNNNPPLTSDPEYDADFYNARQSWALSGMDPNQTHLIFSDLKIREDLPEDWFEQDLSTELKLVMSYLDATGTQITSSTTKEIRLIKGRDPNNMLVSPNPICTSNPPTFLEYIINFENVGTGAVNSVQLDATMDNKLDLSTINVLEVVVGLDTLKSTLVNDPQATPTAAGQIATWLFSSGIQLVSAQTPGVAANMVGDGSQGYVKFRIQPHDPDDLKTCQRVISQTSIIFDNNDPLLTEPAITECSDCKDDPSEDCCCCEAAAADPQHNYLMIGFSIIFIILLLIIIVMVFTVIRKQNQA